MKLALLVVVLFGLSASVFGGSFKETLKPLQQECLEINKALDENPNPNSAQLDQLGARFLKLVADVRSAQNNAQLAGEVVDIPEYQILFNKMGDAKFKIAAFKYRQNQKTAGSIPRGSSLQNKNKYVIKLDGGVCKFWGEMQLLLLLISQYTTLSRYFIRAPILERFSVFVV